MNEPELVGPETVARLRVDYAEEVAGLTDDGVLEKYGYADHRYEAPAIWNNVGDAENDYNDACDLLAAAKRQRDALEMILRNHRKNMWVILSCDDPNPFTEEEFDKHTEAAITEAKAKP